MPICLLGRDMKGVVPDETRGKKELNKWGRRKIQNILNDNNLFLITENKKKYKFKNCFK